MNLDRLKSNFPENAEIPELILRLAEYDASVEGFISPDFEMFDDGRDAVQALFLGDEDGAAQFAVFARTIDESLFGFWLYDDHDLESAPIVLLTSEGVGSRVVASSVEEFLQLITFGCDDYSVEVRYLEEEWDDPEEIDENLEAFRSWAEKEIGITPCESPTELIQRAGAEHPDLMNWIEERQAELE